MDAIASVFQTIVDLGNAFLEWHVPATPVPWFVALLVGTGIYTTFRMGWIQVHKFRHSIDVIRGKYDNPEDEGDINHFQALTTALSATVGIGNIAGVAIAIHFGGPGALFWMWVTAVFGMALKYAECTLSMHHREFDEVGNAAGGPMYYIERGMGKSWKWLAVAFAFCAIISSFGGGNMNQANTVAAAARSQLGAPEWLTGAVLVALVGAVILGGIRRIGRVTAKLAPTMAALYVFAAVVILLENVGQLPGILGDVFREAFNPSAGVGGVGAGVFSMTLLWGVKRGLFSNEAGQGSAPIAHAAAKTKEPVREGIVAMIGPFIDTLVICSMTGFVILSAGVWNQKKQVEYELGSVGVEIQAEGAVEFSDGTSDDVAFSANDGPMDETVVMVGGAPFSGRVAVTDGALDLPDGAMIHGRAFQTGQDLTAWAFEEGLGSIGGWIVTLCVFLFALSTAISWSYYGDRCVQYLFGHRWVTVYRVIYCVFLFIGANTALTLVWAYGDLALGLMTIPNLIAILWLSGTVRKLTSDYLRREHRTYK